ncbi:MAG: hypothetical protein QGI09_07610, partial [Dehalococcoidia bacterium]|nr:hypothetical protein [Dehalococcoidia bacterium]
MEQFHQHDLERLWYRLKPDERRCVYAYRVSASKAEAARRIGKNQKWLEYSSRAHPEFREAMDRAWEWDHDEMKRLTYADLR